MRSNKFLIISIINYLIGLLIFKLFIVLIKSLILGTAISAAPVGVGARKSETKSLMVNKH